MSENEIQCCANCGLPLSPDECHCCDDCAAFYEMTDPHFKMEDKDGEPS